MTMPAIEERLGEQSTYLSFRLDCIRHDAAMHAYIWNKISQRPSALLVHLLLTEYDSC